MSWLTNLFEGTPSDTKPSNAPVFLANTLTGRKEPFVPLKPGTVFLYTCGPTVYSRQHIGNLRAGLFSDTLARVLSGAGYSVHRVINITDVGHLTDDADAGEDKIAVGAKREGLSPTEIAERYAKLFIDDLAELNVDTKDIRFPRATEYIQEQIALAHTLEEKGFAYRIADGLYFDTSRFPGYGKLSNLSGAELLEGARVTPAGGKRNPADFALWRAARPGDLQQWDSPWGKGNPGWHLECSAMARSLLGQEIDIHTGGEDLASIHHNDEIAQSEAASGRQFVRYWLHNAFLTIGGEKVSKSLGNVVLLDDLSTHSIHPLALRYFFLQAHYRTPLSFSWDALSAADSGLTRLWDLARGVASEAKRKSENSEGTVRFLAAMRDDLGTPQALGILWEALRSEDVSPEEKYGLLTVADSHLGLSLLSPPRKKSTPIPKDVQNLVKEREKAREAKDFARADTLRTDIENSGYHVDDGPSGPVVTKRAQ